MFLVLIGYGRGKSGVNIRYVVLVMEKHSWRAWLVNSFPRNSVINSERQKPGSLSLEDTKVGSPKSKAREIVGSFIIVFSH